MEDVRFCGRCGAGVKVPSDRFCRACGAPLHRAAPAGTDGPPSAPTPPASSRTGGTDAEPAAPTAEPHPVAPTPGSKVCPRCELVNVGTAPVCDCGHEFATGRRTAPLSTELAAVPAPHGARLVGALVNFVLFWSFLIFCGVVVGIAGAVVAPDPTERAIDVLTGDASGRALNILVLVALVAPCWAVFGTTPGKFLVGLRLVTGEGRRPHLGQAIGRALVMGVASPLWFTWWFALGRNDHRALHDLVAGTRWVKVSDPGFRWRLGRLLGGIVRYPQTSLTVLLYGLAVTSVAYWLAAEL